MTRSKDKDTVSLKIEIDRKSPRNQYRSPPALNFDAIPVSPVAGGDSNASPIPQLVKPLAPIKVGKWVFDPQFKQRSYVPYLMGAAFALLLGVAGVVIYLTSFQTRPQSATAQSGIKKLFALTLETSAGSGEPGSKDGFGSDASFNSPTGVTADSQGNIYVCDTNNNAVRKINTTGFVSTLAGNASQPPGFSDGKRGGALFNAPIGITLDSTSGLLYVADSNNSLIRQVDPANGAVLTIAGNISLQPDYQDGQATSASFSNPFGVASDSLKNLYITDFGNNLVRKINSSRYVSTFAGVRTFGAALLTNLNKPLAITIDSMGNLYVVNQGSSQILKITTLNEVTTVTPFVNLTADTSSSSSTTAIAVDSGNNLWILLSPPLSETSQLQSFQIVSIATEAVQIISLSSSTPSFGYIAFKPDGDLVSSSTKGNLVVSFNISVVFDNGTSSRSSSSLAASSTQSNQVSTSSPTASIRINPLGNVTTFAGSGKAAFVDGMGLAASFNLPSSVAFDLIGNLFVADELNHRIRKISPSGNVSTLAGSGLAIYVDGVGTAASFRNPLGVAVDSDGMVYVGDWGNHRIRKINPAGTVSTLAGSGTATFANGVGLGASFNGPRGVAVDSTGSVYVADESNNRIRKISPSGAVSTLAGSGSATFANGVGLGASFNAPSGVAVDSNGTVYVADYANHRIRKISPSGNVSTIAGSGSADFADGMGLAASFFYPRGVAVDSNGNVFVADRTNHRIRKIDPSGNVSTLAGSGLVAFANGEGSAASFNYPRGVAVATDGTIYIGDQYNNRIRKITFTT